MISDIEKLLDLKVRPLFENHGGGIKIVSLNEGVLKVKMLGACGQCASAALDVEEIVTKEIKSEFPNIKEVLLVTGVSDELISAARDIMRGR